MTGMQFETVRCPSCGREIIWAVNQAGAALPLDVSELLAALQEARDEATAMEAHLTAWGHEWKRLCFEARGEADAAESTIAGLRERLAELERTREASGTFNLVTGWDARQPEIDQLREQVEGLQRLVDAVPNAFTDLETANEWCEEFTQANNALVFSNLAAATRPVPASALCANCGKPIVRGDFNRWLHEAGEYVTCQPGLPMVDTQAWFEKNAARPAAPGDGALPPVAHPNQKFATRVDGSTMGTGWCDKHPHGCEARGFA